MNKMRLWALLALPLLVISCKKDDPAPAPEVKFMSFTTGSSWNYRLVSNPSSTPVTTDYTITATSRDTVINSKTYKVFTNSAGGSEYYNITGSDYYTYRKLPDELGGSYIEVLYLKDNVAAGGTWSQTTPVAIQGFTISLTLNNTIAQKGISKVVNGITYTDVVDVSTTLAATIPVPYTLTSDINYFYSPKFGQIQNSTIINLAVPSFMITSNFEAQTTLVSSAIL